MSVLMIVRKYIIQNEEWYVFYKHKDVRNNEEYSITPLDGTNNAIKHSSSSTPILKWSLVMHQQITKMNQYMTGLLHLHLPKFGVCSNHLITLNLLEWMNTHGKYAGKILTKRHIQICIFQSLIVHALLLLTTSIIIL